MKQTKSKIGFVFGAVLVGAFTGCVAYVDRPPRGSVYIAPPVQAEVVIQDDFVYYPSYQVYYSSNRRQYIYLQGRTWVTRPSPPRVSVDVLFASPSVRLDFHDAPSLHHATVVRDYPKRWTPPPGQGRGNDQGRGQGSGNNRDNGGRRGRD